MEDNVLLGPIKHLSEIYDIICQSDFGVVPYCDDQFMNLALSTKTFEYVASGSSGGRFTPFVPCPNRVPKIASRLSEDPGNEFDCAEKILQLCIDPELMKNRVRAALDAYAPYSGEVNAEKFRADKSESFLKRGR